MRRPDDSSLTAPQLKKVRSEAHRALIEADALGVFPTPIPQIMDVANIQEVDEGILDDGFISKIRSKAEGALKSATAKVLGLFHATAGLVYIDNSLIDVRKRFIRLHESGHGFMKWQRSMYKVVEDCERSLDHDTADLFDREANFFASEVLFQLDSFSNLAKDHEFSIWTPIKLSKKFQASIYSSIRQYVSKNDRMCAVLVLNMPEIDINHGYIATLRRAIQSSSFTECFGSNLWLNQYTPDDVIGESIPLERSRSSGQRMISLTDVNGESHECVIESFTNTYQVFLLIHQKTLLTSTRIILPASAMPNISD